jgi:hypothetical protein
MPARGVLVLKVSAESRRKWYVYTKKLAWSSRPADIGSVRDIWRLLLTALASYNLLLCPIAAVANYGNIRT